MWGKFCIELECNAIENKILYIFRSLLFNIFCTAVNVCIRIFQMYTNQCKLRAQLLRQSIFICKVYKVKQRICFSCISSTKNINNYYVYLTSITSYASKSVQINAKITISKKCVTKNHTKRDKKFDHHCIVNHIWI